MKEWLAIIPEDERNTYKAAGFGGETKIGKNTALLVIDVTYGFTGLPGQTLEDAIAQFATACGPTSWDAMPRIKRLIAIFRELERPVVFTRAATENTPFSGRATKANRHEREAPLLHNEIPDVITPCDTEWVLGKTKASAFFQTPLTSYLVQKGIDSVVVCGVSTSGCVRATVIDSFSNGFPTFVIDDCCFDRSNFAHCANLFDMNAKYATVVSLKELEKLMFGDQMDVAG